MQIKARSRKHRKIFRNGSGFRDLKIAKHSGWRNVTVARYETDRIVVSDGLSKGDIVVTVDVNRLREREKVRTIEGEAK